MNERIKQLFERAQAHSMCPEAKAAVQATGFDPALIRAHPSLHAWVSWLGKRGLLPTPIWDAYEATYKPAWDALEATCKQAWDAHGATCKQAEDAYVATRKQAGEAHGATCKQ